MDQRYSAYAQLLALWRMVHDGARAEGVSLAPRYGDLFHPDRYPFLEGRSQEPRQVVERIESPLVGDGTIYRVLEKLIVLDGERISYRALDVEHIGSVYETMMGFRLERATGRSVAIKAAKRHGAPAALDLEDLLDQTPGSRAKWIRDRTDRKLTAKASKAVREADTIDEMHAALASVIDRNATPDLVPLGNMVLQPSEERRRSGSHYTPRELTEPIVRKALEPIMARLSDEAGGPPSPEQILDLKVCDPAMGSGAFLVEACRQLADTLIEAWRAQDIIPEAPPDEDETVFARRLVAQRCVYGVDRNPKAVDLAKLSLWLTTLAKEHPFTFLDHALRHGDSLVGLSVQQLQSFHWKGNARAFAAGFEALKGRGHLAQAGDLRQLIQEAGNTVPDWELRDLHKASLEETSAVRFIGDLVAAAFFEGSTAKEREVIRRRYADEVLTGNVHHLRSGIDELRRDDPPVAPFHWDVEFPEVFDRDNPGFDAIVGNPPFGGHVTVVKANVSGYTDWLRLLHSDTKGKCDVVAHFFRRSYSLIRRNGTLGMVATNTIAQGDTRFSGLRWICNNGGEIYYAAQRVKWPGTAAVIVSVINLQKGPFNETRFLNGKPVQRITAFLFHRGGHDHPSPLMMNMSRSFQGSITLGMGFTFDDTDKKGVATPLSEMRRLLRHNPHYQEVIFPYIGGKEFYTSPTQSHHRYVIDLGERSEDECRRRWPDLLAILEERVKPERLRSVKNSKSSHAKRAAIWWQIYHRAKELYTSIQYMERVLAVSYVGQHASFAFLPTGMVFAGTLIVIPLSSYAAFCAMQARAHELWARSFGSSLEDRLRYTPSECFETYPFPANWEHDPCLEVAGREYYAFRKDLMARNNEGMTKTYNRLHNPLDNSPEVIELRRLHGTMDRAVLDAYGWTDIPADCEFLLDYEIDEETWGRRKKPYRYRWPDDVRDEVLARLLELNAKRAAEEARAGND